MVVVVTLNRQNQTLNLAVTFVERPLDPPPGQSTLSNKWTVPLVIILSPSRR
jgi:hypothetical protein